MKRLILLMLMLPALVMVASPGRAVEENAIIHDENTKLWKDHGTISDLGLKAIEVAKPEWLKQGPTSEPSTINVIETDRLFEVTFCLKSHEQKIIFTQEGKNIGEWPRCPGSFTVELDKVTLKVLSHHYNRD